VRTFFYNGGWNDSMATLLAAEATRPIDPTGQLFFNTITNFLNRNCWEYLNSEDERNLNPLIY